MNPACRGATLELRLARPGRVVVDVFDALLEERAYRPPWPVQDIIEHFKENSGVLYDPTIVENFFQLMDFQ